MILTINGCEIQRIEYSDPIKVFDEYSSYYYSTLYSGMGHEDISQFSFIGTIPHTIIRYDNDKFEIENAEGLHFSEGDFWETFNSIFEMSTFNDLEFPANLCGAAGYLTYDAYQLIEKIDRQTSENYHMPLFEIVFFNNYIIFDHQNKQAYEINILYDRESHIKKKSEYHNSINLTNMKHECNKNDYLDKVNKIINYIIEGDAYEVCLTEQFSADFKGDPYILFKKIFNNNPAPFSAFMNNRDIKILCNSPELFLRCRGPKVETRPIKGTAPRGDTPEKDNKNKEMLLTSEKDQAELFMIIDLLRNDIGKVCKTGTVEVIDEKRIEAYQNVFQLIGIVEGTLDEKYNYVDLIRAAFPGGSITGCPKIRSMEIIEELETYKRNLYTGTIFLLNKEMLISNIVIRTAIIKDDRMYFNSGGAITINSCPENEYDEIIYKIKHIMKNIL